MSVIVRFSDITRTSRDFRIQSLHWKGLRICHSICVNAQEVRAYGNSLRGMLLRCRIKRLRSVSANIAKNAFRSALERRDHACDAILSAEPRHCDSTPARWTSAVSNRSDGRRNRLRAPGQRLLISHQWPRRRRQRLVIDHGIDVIAHGTGVIDHALSHQ
jgi:hypothetical protein